MDAVLCAHNGQQDTFRYLREVNRYVVWCGTCTTTQPPFFPAVLGCCRVPSPFNIAPRPETTLRQDPRPRRHFPAHLPRVADEQAGGVLQGGTQLEGGGHSDAQADAVPEERVLAHG